MFEEEEEEEEEDEIIGVSEWNITKDDKVYLQDAIVFMKEGSIYPMSGIIIGMFLKNEKAFFQVVVLTPALNGKKDLVYNGKYVYYHYITNAIIEVSIENVLRSVYYILRDNETSIRAYINEIEDNDITEIIYFDKCQKCYDFSLVPAIDIPTQILWFHYNPIFENVEHYLNKNAEISATDPAVGWLANVKKVIFDPFVSSLSWSKLKKKDQNLWNVKTWKLLIHHTLRPIPDILDRLKKVQNGSEDDRAEVFVFPERSIPFIMATLQKWLKPETNSDEMDVYEATQYLENLEKIIDKYIMKYFTYLIEKEPDEVAEDIVDDDNDSEINDFILDDEEVEEEEEEEEENADDDEQEEGEAVSTASEEEEDGDSV